MTRLLIVGAGAAVEECIRSGARSTEPDWYLPVIANFGRKLFNPTSDVLMRVAASYLEAQGVQFETKLLNHAVGGSFTANDMQRGPIGVFLNLESNSPEMHNVERLCEHAWHLIGTDHRQWGRIVHDAIYLHLFALFTEQFGLGVGRPMLAGREVASRLQAGDAVLNLNYDGDVPIAVEI